MYSISRSTIATGLVGFLALIAIAYPYSAQAKVSIGQLDKSTSVALNGSTGDSGLQHLGKGITGVINELCIDIADGNGEYSSAAFYFWHQPTNTLSAEGADRTFIFIDNFFAVPPTETISCKKFTSHIFDPDQYYFIFIAPRYSNAITLFGSDQNNAWSGNNNLGLITCPVDQCLETSAVVKDIYFSGIEKRDAVILVPGILGTKMNKATAPFEEVWPGKLLFSSTDNHLNFLSLSTTTGSEIPGQEIALSGILDQATLGKNVYKNILDFFQDNNYPAGALSFQNPYDWRLNLGTTSQTLAQTIQAAITSSESGKVNIVAHSMGGLLVKEFLRAAPTSTINQINKVIFIGTPHLGAPKAAKVLLYGDDLNIPILDEERARVITQNMPSVYQLLPSQKYINDFGGYIIDARSGAKKVFNYDETKQFLTDSSLNSSLLTTAGTFHSTLDTYSTASSIKFFDIVGCGSTKTISSIIAKNNGKFDIGYALGDKTVPYISASSIGNINQRYFSNADHMNLVKDDGVLEQLINIFDDQGSQIADGVSTSTTSCTSNDPAIIFATHSPVDLHVYDSQNRHLGPDALGDIEFGIPGSSYDTVGDNHFAIVPDSATTTYRIVIDAYASGTFDFDWTAMTGSVATTKTSYLNQPIQNASTTATFTYSASSPKPALAIDDDGNGTIDKSVNPTATVTGATAIDITPPTITITSPYGLALFDRSELVQLAATAHDSESGIAFFETRLDSKLLTTPTLDLFNQKLGDHTLNYLAFDKAGNPTELEQELTITADSASTIADVERAYALGWIKKKDIKTDLIKDLKTIIKIERKIMKLDAQLPHSPGKKASGQKITKTIEKLQSSIDKKLGKNFLAEVEKKYKNGNITLEGYALLKEDVEWMMR